MESLAKKEKGRRFVCTFLTFNGNFTCFGEKEQLPINCEIPGTTSDYGDASSSLLVIPVSKVASVRVKKTGIYIYLQFLLCVEFPDTTLSTLQLSMES